MQWEEYKKLSVAEDDRIGSTEGWWYHHAGVLDYYYHVSPRNNRDRIQAHGLYPTFSNESNYPPEKLDNPGPLQKNPPPVGIYFSRTPQGARKWTQFGLAAAAPFEGSDVWRFPRSAVQEMYPDPHVRGAFYTPHPISQVELHQPAEAQENNAWYEHINYPVNDPPRYWGDQESEPVFGWGGTAPHEIAQNPQWGIGFPNHVIGSWHEAMAADPYWLDNWMERNGPYLWHRTPRKENVPSILQRGLLPWDTEGIGSLYNGIMAPRPGHVYLRGEQVGPKTKPPPSNEPFVKSIWPSHFAQDPQYVRVDLRKLNPENLNPDEDMIADEEGAKRWNWPKQEDPYDTSIVAMEPYKNWGEWAEGVGANTPAQTAWSLERGGHPGLDWPGTIAHRGPISPEAIDYPYGQLTNLPPQRDIRDTLGQPMTAGWRVAALAPPNPAKFITTLTQHNRRKRKYLKPPAPPKPPKHSIADPEFVQKYMNEGGNRYMYHGTTPEAVQKILKEGLFPHDELGTGEEHTVCPNCNYEVDPEWEAGGGAAERAGDPCPSCGGDYLEDRPEYSNSTYAGQFFEPRSGHTYLGTKEYARSYGNSKGAMVRVDLSKLNPLNMNADEDHFADHPQNQPWHPVVEKVWQDEPPPNAEYWSPGENESLGQWADNARLGQEPEETHYSMGKGSMAYHGHIPPEAIEEVNPSTYQPYPPLPPSMRAPEPEAQTNPGQQQLFARTADLYHVAPTEERDRIKTWGLQPADPFYDNGLGPEGWEEQYGPEFRPPVGVYGFPTPEQAGEWGGIGGWGAHHQDIWRFPGEGEVDPDTAGARYIPHAVEPTLHEGPEHRLGWHVAGTSPKPWEAKMWHGKTVSRGLMGPVRTPFFSTSFEGEAHGFAGDGGSVHPVSIRFHNPAHYFAHATWGPGSLEDARQRGADGAVVHWPADERDPSDPYPARTWAIALDPGTVVPGHLKDSVTDDE